MATNEITAICIWPDTVGERNEDGSYRWIVSRDVMDAGTHMNITNHTLAVCDDREEALASAQELAVKETLPLYENSEHTVPELIRPAPEWEHIGDAGTHRGHHLHADEMQDVHCWECDEVLTDDGAAEAWPLESENDGD